MAQNTLPTNGGLLIGLANKMYAGVVSIGKTVGVTMVTAKQIQTALNLFIGEEASFNAARSAGQTASDTYQKACGAIYEWLLAARKILAVHFGDKWSTQWAQAGFTDATTAVPTRVEDRIALVLLLVKFFTANKSYEIPSINVTAARGTALRKTALATQQKLATAEVKLKTLGDSWTIAYDKLTAVMRKLIKNLDGELAKDDPRWIEFGLNIPASPSTPGKPVNLTAHADDTGAIVVQCDPVPLATRYRWRMLLVGIQKDYQLAASSPAPLGTIADVAPGQTAQIIVQAVNGSQQGVASDPIEFLMPGLRAADAKAAPAAEPPSTKRESHRNGNGNGKGRHAIAGLE